MQGLDYQYVEINPYEDAQSEKEFTKKALSIDAKRERYPDFIAVSPWGLVPGLQEPPTVDSTRVCDSMAVLRYLEDAYPTTRPLLPSTPSQRAVSGRQA